MNISAIAVCRKELYAPREELMGRYPADTVDKVVRVRDMHQMLMADPTRPARVLVQEIMHTYGVSEQTAYADLRVVREITPLLTEAKRSFHRWQANEMLMETWQRAREKGDLKTMEKAAADYARYNRVDLDDEKEEDYTAMRVQPFVPTMDPSVLGIAPIPNLQDKIDALLAKYTRETIDIEDVSYEEADLQESELFDNPEKSGTDESPHTTGL